MLARDGTLWPHHDLRCHIGRLAKAITPVTSVETDNFIFRGDDTTTAKAKVKLASVVLATPCPQFLPTVGSGR